jgi:hypothetical protein
MLESADTVGSLDQLVVCLGPDGLAGSKVGLFEDGLGDDCGHLIQKMGIEGVGFDTGLWFCICLLNVTAPGSFKTTTVVMGELPESCVVEKKKLQIFFFQQPVPKKSSHYWLEKSGAVKLIPCNSELKTPKNLMQRPG